MTPSQKTIDIISIFNDEATCKYNLKDAALCKEVQVIPSGFVVPVGDDREKTAEKPTNYESTAGTGLSCSSCKLKFCDVTEQRAHCKLDWHRYNVKLKIQNKEPISEEEFEKNYEDGFSSISGSDSESEHESEQNSSADVEQDLSPKRKLINGEGKVMFITPLGNACSVYASVVLPDKSKDLFDALDSDITLRHCLDDSCWVIFMLSGGHFAAAVFHRDKVVEHKTFHRYTVRAKSGMSQSVRDGKQGGNSPKSVGASIRRYNEAALVKDIQELFKSWKVHISHASKIFYRLSVYNKKIFFSGKDPLLLKDDVRLRKIPFVTNRPTLKEVKRVHQTLSTVRIMSISASPSSKSTVNNEQCHGNHSSSERISESKSELRDLTLTLDPAIEQPSRTSVGISTNNCQVNKSPDVVVDDMKEDECQGKAEVMRFAQTLFDALNKEKEAVVLDFLKENFGTPTLCEDNNKNQNDESNRNQTNSELWSTIPPSDFLNTLYSERKETLLHVASRTGHAETVWNLLRSGADPCVKDGQNRLPYNISSSKEVRNTYRRFMANYPSKYNYAIAQVPSPLTDEMTDKKDQKAKEKKKKQDQERKARQKIKKQQQQEAARIAKEECKEQVLTDREKRLQAAEARLASQSKGPSVKCYTCQGQVPISKSFSKHNKTFCCMECLGKCV